MSDEQSVAEAVEDQGRPDHVPEKFWNEETSSINADAAVKSYSELEKRFGGFTGAPESYEFKLSEELTGNGMELSKDDPMISQFSEFAKESGMDQDTANKLVNMYVEGQFSDSQGFEDAENSRVESEMKLLGENAVSRVENISTWANANLDPELIEGLEGATTTAAGVKAVEALIAKSRNSPMVAESQPVDTVSDAELTEMQFKLDEHGNRLMNTDPEHRKKVEELFRRKYGDGDNRIIVG